jgi:hypothetical protein
VHWSLDGPQGNILPNRAFTSSDGQNGLSLLNLSPGAYTVTVSANGDTTGGYQFRLLDLALATSITPGTVVSNALNVAKETDLYRFNVAAGSRFYFDWLGGSVSANTYWRLLDPFGTPVFASTLGEPGVLAQRPQILHGQLAGAADIHRAQQSNETRHWQDFEKDARLAPDLRTTPRKCQ